MGATGRAAISARNRDPQSRSKNNAAGDGPARSRWSHRLLSISGELFVAALSGKDPECSNERRATRLRDTAGGPRGPPAMPRNHARLPKEGNMNNQQGYDKLRLNLADEVACAIRKYARSTRGANEINTVWKSSDTTVKIELSTGRFVTVAVGEAVQ